MSCENLVVQSATKKQGLDIEGKIDTISTNTNGIESKVDIIDTNIDTLNIDATNIEAKVDIVDTNVDTANGKIGETTDDAQDYTLLGYNNSLYQHVHNPAMCYPSLADGVTVAGGVGSWTLGNFVEIVPANTITHPFDVHWINFESVSANDVYEFVLYAGSIGNEVEIGRCRTYKTSTASGSNSVVIQIPAQNANTRISAKLASAGGGDSATVSLFYHNYNII